ncbi:MAG: hypothetical protein WDN10_03740 [bacterium]
MPNQGSRDEKLTAEDEAVAKKLLAESEADIHQRALEAVESNAKLAYDRETGTIINPEAKLG